tara:strand:+ start:380 stop:820 length:441 start_codon:yes stop_codon:yes gene_type:complete
MAVDAKTGQSIFGRYNVGIHNVGSYQVSGIPWLSGSALAANEEHKLEFPMVTKSITIIASGAFDSGELRVSFAATGSEDSPVLAAGRHISMAVNESSFTFNVKAKEVYVSANKSASEVGYMCVAELTNIPAANMYIHTGSGISDSA